MHFFHSAFNEQRAKRHTYHGADRRYYTENGNKILAAEDNRCGLHLNTHCHLPAEAEEIRDYNKLEGLIVLSAASISLKVVFPARRLLLFLYL